MNNSSMESEALVMENNYLEIDLPKELKESIDNYTLHKNTSSWDIFYCELQADINFYEVEQIITSKQANYLRDKYL